MDLGAIDKVSIVRKLFEGRCESMTRTSRRCVGGICAFSEIFGAGGFTIHIINCYVTPLDSNSSSIVTAQPSHVTYLCK